MIANGTNRSSAMNLFIEKEKLVKVRLVALTSHKFGNFFLEIYVANKTQH